MRPAHGTWDTSGHRWRRSSSREDPGRPGDRNLAHIPCSIWSSRLGARDVSRDDRSRYTEEHA
jgi:hypothetical protein